MSKIIHYIHCWMTPCVIALILAVIGWELNKVPELHNSLGGTALFLAFILCCISCLWVVISIAIKLHIKIKEDSYDI